MKLSKVIAGCLLGAVLSTSAVAHDSWKKSVDLTVGQMDIKGETGINFGFDSRFEKNIIDGSYGALYLGAGVGMEFFEAPETDALDDGFGGIFDIYPTISYNVADTDLSVNALVGYSVGAFGGERFRGMTWGVGAEYKITDRWSLGVSYKLTDGDFDGIEDNIDLKRTSAYFTRSF